MTNTFIGIGRLTKAAELRVSPNGTQIATFTVAINRMKRDDPADFLNCVCFNKQAENLVNYTDKGSQVAVEGRVQTRNYENKEGVRVYVTEILCNRVQFLDSKGGQQQGGGQQTQQNNDPFSGNGQPIDISDDSLPF